MDRNHVTLLEMHLTRFPMRILLSLLYIVATIVSFGLATGPARAAGKTEQTQNSDSELPMQFAIVRSQAIGCEPNCPQWISAEGAITRQTPKLFKKILKQVGNNRLPILITSSGGDIDAAIAIGEIIRARGLDVGVGWTLFAGCWPNDKICLIHGQQQGVFHGIPVTWRAYCVSACSFVLAGGRRRLAGGASLAITEFSRTVTSQRVIYEERYRTANGKKKVISRKIVKREPVKSYTTSKLDKSARKKLTAYAGRMGLAKDFLVMFTKPQSGSAYFLTSKEALSVGLVTDYDNARSLVDNQLCQATPSAENCIRLVASTKQELQP